MTIAKTNITWRNHYVPQFILKNFLDYSVDSKGKIHICDKTLDESQKIEQRNTDTTGYIQHLYTVEDNNGNPTDIIERHLEIIDTSMSKIVTSIISNNNILINNKNVLNPLEISSSELKTVIKFLAFQVIRSPKNFTIAAQTMHAFDYILNAFSETIPHIPPAERLFFNDEIAPITFNLETIEEFSKLFATYYYFVIINPEANFLIGDSGLSSRFHFSHPDNEIFLPLTPRICLAGIRKIFVDDSSANNFFSVANKNSIICKEVLFNVNMVSIKDAKQFIFNSKAYDKALIKEICASKSPQLMVSTGKGLITPKATHISRWKKNKFK